MLLICGRASGVAERTSDGLSAAISTVRRARGPIVAIGSEVLVYFSMTGSSKEDIFSRRSGICIVGVENRVGVDNCLFIRGPID